ncbi:hypothetical protein AYI70_g10230, partial [Smittium culicis]
MSRNKDQRDRTFEFRNIVTALKKRQGSGAATKKGFIGGGAATGVKAGVKQNIAKINEEILELQSSLDSRKKGVGQQAAQHN